MAGPDQRYPHVVAGVTPFVSVQGHRVEIVQGTGKVAFSHEDIGQHQAAARLIGRFQPFHIVAIEDHGGVGVVAFAVVQGGLV